MATGRWMPNRRARPTRLLDDSYRAVKGEPLAIGVSTGWRLGNQELLTTAGNSRQSHIFSHKVLDFRCKQSVTVGALSSARGAPGICPAGCRPCCGASVVTARDAVANPNEDDVDGPLQFSAGMHERPGLAEKGHPLWPISPGSPPNCAQQRNVISRQRTLLGRIVNRKRSVVVLFANHKVAHERKSVPESDLKPAQQATSCYPQATRARCAMFTR
jgi:hypothetical protein